MHFQTFDLHAYYIFEHRPNAHFILAFTFTHVHTYDYSSRAPFPWELPPPVPAERQEAGGPAGVAAAAPFQTGRPARGAAVRAAPLHRHRWRERLSPLACRSEGRRPALLVVAPVDGGI